MMCEISSRRHINRFSNALRRFNGEDKWALGLTPLRPDRSFAQMLKAGELSTQCLQAAGLPDAMTVEIAKTGGVQWGAQWVRYTVGRADAVTEPFDVPIALAHGVKMISRSQVFDADEAAEVFFTYYKTGDIPDTYTLQPIEGYRADGTRVDLSDHATQRPNN